MADQKVSAFPDGAPVLGADKFPFVRGGDTTNYVATAAELAAYVGGALIPGAGIVYSTGSALAAATTGAGVSFSGGTLSNTGILSIDTATGAILIGAGLQRASQTVSVKPATTAALGGVIVGSNITVNAGGTISVGAPGTGTVTSVTTAGALSGGTITGAGTIGLAVSTGLTISAAGTIAVVPATTLALGGIIAGTNTTINAGGTLSVAAPGAGTVTSVAETFTGGLISVANSPITGAGTLGLTVAGTSGGAVIFNSNSTWSSTTLMPTNALVLGGGAAVGFKTVGALTTNGVGGINAGLATVGTGYVDFAGSSSGNFKFTVPNTVGGSSTASLPASLGTAGQPWLSGGAGGQITVGTLGVPGGGTGLAAWTANTLVYASGTATLAGAVLPAGWAITSGTLVPSSTITVGLANDLTNTIPVGTYDLGPVIQGGTVLNSYAHVVSGTITYTGAIGQPGTYATITGMSAITSTSTTIDTIGTATAANVIAAGAHLWVIIGGTPPPGGDVFFTIKVP